MGNAVGYVAANKETGKFKVMMEVDGQKHYAEANLSDVLEVATGRRANVALWKRQNARNV
jgi:hypothetical protein